MASKKAKNKAKGSIPKAATIPAKKPETSAKKPPVKKKKKNDPLKPQPAWLFPPDEENPILNPKNKSKEQIQKEIEDRLAAINYLKHKSVTSPVKTAPPLELLQLIGAFFASYGFISTGRIFSLERNARKKLDGWSDEVGEKRFPKNMPDLVKIFKDWRADWEEDSDAETSSSGEDSEEDVKMEDAASDSDSSSSDSDGQSQSDEEEQAGPKTNGVKIRTKLTKSTTNGVEKKIRAASPSSSSGSESESDSGSEEETEATKTAEAASASASDSDSEDEEEAPKQAEKKQDASASDSESSSSSESESDSDDDSTKEQATKVAEDTKKTTLPTSPILAKAGSESSETLRGNSPAKKLSPSVSTSESDSNSSSSSSDSETDSPAPQRKAETPKLKKRKASSSDEPSSSSANDSTAQAPKRAKVANEPFSRIPKDTKVDPRLASNRYVSYDYADRAHKDLIVTKGKGFTKEKNKKKRGS